MSGVVDKELAFEGGLVNNPADRGGITKYGITKATLEWYLKRPVTDDDIKGLSVDVAKDIYTKKFIIGPGFSNLPSPLLENIVDFGVMSGPSLAIANLQAVLQVPASGKIDDVTMDAVRSSNVEKVNVEIVKRRVQMAGRLVAKVPSQAQFLNGWLSRILSFL